MYRKILVAFDGSPQASQGFDQAVDIARAFSAEIFVLWAVQLPEPAIRVELDAILEESTSHHQGVLADLERRAKSQGVTIRTELSVGHPAEKVLSHAESEGFDLIVCGRRGGSAFDRWLLGSVSARLVRYARCAVLVVH